MHTKGRYHIYIYAIENWKIASFFIIGYWRQFVKLLKRSYKAIEKLAHALSSAKDNEEVTLSHPHNLFARARAHNIRTKSKVRRQGEQYTS